MTTDTSIMAKINFDPVISDSQPSTSGPTASESTPAINIGAVSTYKIDSLKEGNWVVWQSRMTTILKFHNASEHVVGTLPKPLESAGQAKWEQRDLLAQILIKNNTSDEQMVHINQETITTAAEMWQSL